MDETLRDSAPGRQQRGGGVTVKLCAWCKTITIRNVDQIKGCLTVEVKSKTFLLDGWEAEHQGIIQDGICEACRAAKFPETVKR